MCPGDYEPIPGSSDDDSQVAVEIFVGRVRGELAGLQGPAGFWAGWLAEFRRGRAPSAAGSGASRDARGAQPGANGRFLVGAPVGFCSNISGGWGSLECPVRRCLWLASGCRQLVVLSDFCSSHLTQGTRAPSLAQWQPITNGPIEIRQNLSWSYLVPGQQRQHAAESFHSRRGFDLRPGDRNPSWRCGCFFKAESMAFSASPHMQSD